MVARGKMKFVVGFAVIISALLFLAFSGYEESKAYYRTVEEVKSLSPAEMVHRYRVAGNVEEGTIQFVGEGVDFLLVEGSDTLPVQYRGSDPVPDTFRDGSEAIVTGTIRDDGTFEAVKIQAKCASKYEAEYDPENHTLETAANRES